MKVAIGIATSDYIKTQTVGTIVSLIRSDPSIGMFIKQGPYVHANREGVVVQALNSPNKYTHIFFIDSDMVFKSEVLAQLLSHDKDIVGGMYYRREGKFKDPIVNLRFDTMPTKIFKNYAAGTGCLLIKLDVFKGIPQPWFFYGSEDRQLGEDIYFCDKAAKNGFETWIDPNVEVGHVGEYVYTRNSPDE